MQVSISFKTILIVVAISAVVVGYTLVVVKPFAKRAHVTDWKAVAACQKTVQNTYSSLLGEASVEAPGTASGISKEQQNADQTCVTSNTH